MVDLDIDNIVDSLAQSFKGVFGGGKPAQIRAEDLTGKNDAFASNALGGPATSAFGDVFSTLGNAPFMPDIFGSGGAIDRADQDAAAHAANPAAKIKWVRDHAGKVVGSLVNGVFTLGTDLPASAYTGGTGFTGAGGGSSSFGGDPSTGLEPDVARWAAQTKSTFADIRGLDPDTMLAIMTNESHGKPDAYNTNGNAWGLFQQVGLGSNDPTVQFQAAHQLAQEKMAAINAAYAANNLNPDDRTRAVDFALAWAGHFDYSTGRANPNSRDNGVGGQSAADLTAVFLKNYNAIKAGRTAATTTPQGGGTTGTGSITPDVQGTVMQEFGHTDYSAAHPDTYAYGNAYGLAGSQHPGVDWAVPLHSRVATPVGGVVSVVGNDHGTGYYYTNTMTNSDPDRSGEYAVTLDNGDILILGHLSNINVQVGQRVNAGQIIGMSGGSDGAHVHVEYRQRNANGGYTIVDPRSKIRF